LVNALVMAAVIAGFFAPALVSPGQFLSRDAGRHHAPVKRWIAERLALGQLPEWNPHDSLGTPVVASAIDAAQHPFNAFLVAVPFEAGFKAWVLASYLMAAFGAAAWARALGRTDPAAMVAGLAFALSGVLISTSDNLTFLTAFAAVPWVLATGAFAARGLSSRTLLAVGLASALCAAAGDPQAWAIAVALLPLQAVLLAPAGGKGAALANGLASAVAALAFAAPFILPVLAWYPHSARAGVLAEFDRVRYALAPLRLAELVVPGLTRGSPGFTSSAVYAAFADPTGGPWYVSVYAGAAVFALAALGVAVDRRARILAAIAAVFTWMALGHHAGFGDLAIHLPLLGHLRFWEKLTVWPVLAVGAAAAIGFEAACGGGRAARGLAVATGTAALLAAGAGAAGLLGRSALAQALLSSSGAAASAVADRFAGNIVFGLLSAAVAFAAVATVASLAARGRWARAVPVLLASVVILDLAVAGESAWHLAPPTLATPGGPFAERMLGEARPVRIVTPFEIIERPRPAFPDLRPDEAAWLVGGRLLFPAFNVARGIGNLEPASPLPPERVGAFLTRQGRGALLPAGGLFGVGYLVVPRDPSVAASAGLSPPHDVAAVDPEAGGFLIRVPHRPRVYLAGEVVAADRAGAFAFAASGGLGYPARTAIEGPVPLGWKSPGGEARVTRDDPETIEIEVSAPGQVLLIVNDAYAVGWSADVDGRPASIWPANALVRGVWVEGGQHRVAFRYQTPGLRLGWAVLVVAAVVLMTWAAARRR
jgi:hypothetical protein